jgi:hypothetical protein
MEEPKEIELVTVSELLAPESTDEQSVRQREDSTSWQRKETTGRK